MSEDSYDVVIVGAGSGGVSLATDLVDAGKSVALVSSGFVGGECPYVACMPSKSLLRSARARREAQQLVEHGGAGQPAVLDDDRDAWKQAVIRRDETANQRDDSAEASSLQDKGIEVVRGFGRCAGPGEVHVGDRVLRAPAVVLDTGSVPAIPDVDGLDTVGAWTSDEALSSGELPQRLLIMGGGPIGCELADAYSAFGSNVTVVDPADRLVPTEDPQLSALMQQLLETAGVSIRLGRTPRKASTGLDGSTVLLLAGGEEVVTDRVLIVTGRRPAVDGLGLDSVGVRTGDDGHIEVDSRCRAAEGVWAIGDVTGVAPYTHTANHQAMVVRDDILGRGDHEMTPDALPRAVFTEPPLAGTGLTEEQARQRGVDVVTAEVDLADVSRAGAEGDGLLGPDDAAGGLLRLIADRSTGRLVGASAIGPQADEWITEATLAIRASVPISVLADVVRPFPTYAEAFTLGYTTLLGKLG